MGAYDLGVSGTETLAAVAEAAESRVLIEMNTDTGSIRSQVSISLAGERVRVSPTLEGLGDGSVLLAFDSRDRGVEVARYSFDEGVLWSRLIVDAPHATYAYATISAGSGDVFFVAWWAGIGASQGSVVAALGLDGELLWARRAISDECAGHVEGLAATEDGGVVLAGHGNGAGCGVWLAKLDAAGGEEWGLLVGDYIVDWGTLSDGEDALGVAVDPSGEVLAVGMTTNDATPAGGEDALALWVGPTGEVRRMARIQVEEDIRASAATAAAAGPDGGWLLGGRYRWGIPFLASLDAEGGLDHDCEHILEVSLPVRSVPLGGAFLDLPVEEGSLVVGDSDLVVEETTTTAERLCD